MGKILRLLSHGASFAAGVAVGVRFAPVEEHTVYVDEDGEELMAWTGRTAIYDYDQDWAEQLLEYILGWEEYDEFPVDTEKNHPFWKDDLFDLKVQIEHNLGDAEDDEPIKLEITDRQRLLIYDLVVHGPRLDKLSEE